MIIVIIMIVVVVWSHVGVVDLIIINIMIMIVMMCNMREMSKGKKCCLLTYPGNVFAPVP